MARSRLFLLLLLVSFVVFSTATTRNRFSQKEQTKGSQSSDRHRHDRTDLPDFHKHEIQHNLNQHKTTEHVGWNTTPHNQAHARSKTYATSSPKNSTRHFGGKQSSANSTNLNSGSRYRSTTQEPLHKVRNETQGKQMHNSTALGQRNSNVTVLQPKLNNFNNSTKNGTYVKQVGNFTLGQKNSNVTHFERKNSTSIHNNSTSMEQKQKFTNQSSNPYLSQPDAQDTSNSYNSWYQESHKRNAGTTHINYGPTTYVYNNPEPPTYHYTPKDYGDDDFGFYLGYALGKAASPTIHHDHYVVHHYHHNSNGVPKQVAATPNAVVACPNGNAFCSQNTEAMCLSNGTIMCVAKPEILVLCPNTTQQYCVQTVISNFNSTKHTKTINVPCVTNAVLYGNVVNQNNTVLLQDSTSASPVLYCVTVVAQPVARKPDAAVLYDEVKKSVLYFIKKAFGF